MRHWSETAEYTGEIFTAVMRQAEDPVTGDARNTVLLKPGIKRIDSITSNQMGVDLNEIFEHITSIHGPVDYCLDYRELQYASSGCLREMVVLLKRLHQIDTVQYDSKGKPVYAHKVTLILSPVDSRPAEVLQLAGLDNLFGIQDPNKLHPVQ